MIPWRAVAEGVAVVAALALPPAVAAAKPAPEFVTAGGDDIIEGGRVLTERDVVEEVGYVCVNGRVAVA